MKKFVFLFCTMASGYDTSVEYKWERIVSEWMEGKTFVIEPPKNCVPSQPKKEWNIETLARRLVEAKLIPESVEYDAQLYQLLISQLQLQLLDNLVVPKGVQWGNWYRNYETLGVERGAIQKRKQDYKKEFEKYTGVNIDFWYKLAIVENKRKRAIEADPSAFKPPTTKKLIVSRK